MKVQIGDKIIEAYSVEPYIYEVKVGRVKEFYQNPWDAFHSDLYCDHLISAELIRIPVKPISSDEAKYESIALEVGSKRFYPDFVEFKPKRFTLEKLYAEIPLIISAVLMVCSLTMIFVSMYRANI